MLDFKDDTSRREKCYTTISQLPAFIDPKQPPTKRSPFSAILGHPFIHTVEVILPKEIYSNIQDSLDSKLQKLRYARVFRPLSSLLEGDFFNTYIKAGNVLMISEGRSGSDSVFTLRDGILKLELSKEIFERTGLTGKPIRSGARKHAKERYIVEINLRLPSMVHGKKGFERIVWAFKNVLTESVAWLFFDLDSKSNGIAEDDLSLKGSQPQILDCEFIPTERFNTIVPPLHRINITEEEPREDELEEQCNELSEWLAMVSLGSPRVAPNDEVDPYLCRYSVPDADDAKATDLISLKWRGLIPPRWILQLFVLLLRETLNGTQTSSWFSLSSNTLGKEAVEGRDGFAIMAFPSIDSEQERKKMGGGVDSSPQKGGPHFVCWEFVGASVM